MGNTGRRIKRDRRRGNTENIRRGSMATGCLATGKGTNATGSGQGQHRNWEHGHGKGKRRAVGNSIAPFNMVVVVRRLHGRPRHQ